MIDNDYLIDAVESPPLGEVAYVLRIRGRDDAVVIDPGFDARSILRTLADEKRTLAAILNTHGHFDHIAGNEALKAAFPDAPIIVGRNDAPLLVDPEANLSASFLFPSRSPAADRLVDDGECFEVAGFRFETREIPGHSPGSVVFVVDQFNPTFVLGGDVLFAGSVGRTDFAGGNGYQLLKGIRAKLLTLPDAALVFPGHGPPTTIGAERRTNPFLSEGAWASPG